MSRKYIIAAALIGAHAIPAAAQSDARRTNAYIAPLFNAVRVDDARAVDNDQAFTLAGGFRPLPNWNLEASLFRGSFDGAGGDDLDLNAVGLNALRVFRRNAKVQPFVLLGAGSMRKDREITADTRDAYGDVGGGVLVGLRESPETGGELSFRADLRARHDDAAEGSRIDRLLGVGLQYAFGRRAEPAAAARAVAPVPAAPTPAPDDDRDGVANASDRCPATRAGVAVDTNGCELDTDRDNVVNSADQCADTRPGARVDSRGCELRDGIQLPLVTFAFNSADLLPPASAALDDAATTLRMNSDLRIEVAGHTDDSGSDAYNLDLSRRRAETVRQYLVGRGVTNTMTARGHGESQPVADNATEQGRAQNRRVVLRVLSE